MADQSQLHNYIGELKVGWLAGDQWFKCSTQTDSGIARAVRWLFRLVTCEFGHWIVPGNRRVRKEERRESVKKSRACVDILSNQIERERPGYMDTTNTLPHYSPFIKALAKVDCWGTLLNRWAPMGQRFGMKQNGNVWLGPAFSLLPRFNFNLLSAFNKPYPNHQRGDPNCLTH